MAGTQDFRAARRYATALFSSAQQKHKLDAVERDMSAIMELLQNTPSFQKMWNSPMIPAGKKRGLIDSVLGKSLDPVTLSFLHLLVDKRREGILEGVDRELRAQADASRHIVRAEATFAIEPTPAELRDLAASLEQRTNEKVELTYNVNADILGGVIVKLQDTIIDGSVRGKLERLRETLLQEG
jgi:F-type H+-transporting ATPase subunit delta